MIMTDGEIERSYRLASDPKKQIGILADLNGCNKKDIKAVLFKETWQSNLKKLMENRERVKDETDNRPID